MTARESLGELEHLVLLAVLRLGDEAYGMPILDEIEARAGRRLNPGSIYPTLERLERKGWVRSRMGEATAERGGRAKKFYALEPAGLARLRSTRALFHSMSRGFEALLDQDA